MKNSIKILFLCIVLVACTHKAQNELEYDFSRPQKVISLPSELNEISGLHWEKGNEVYAINDEKGIVYSFNTDDNKISDKTKFKKKGDFEGVAKVGNRFFILKSNGTLLTLENGKTTSHTLFKKGYEFEGLCYFKQENSLLLACKEHKKKRSNKFIWVFEYDIASGLLKEDPFLKVEKSKVGKAFKPSGIAVHPDSSIYIISGVSDQIARIDHKSREVKMAQLQGKDFPQLEGICFTNEGELYLASEKAILQHAKLYIFNKL